MSFWKHERFPAIFPFKVEPLEGLSNGLKPKTDIIPIILSGKDLLILNLTDTHCHLDLEVFDPDRQVVLDRAWASGLIRILIPALNLSSSQRVLELANQHPYLFCAIGVHPNDSLSWDKNTKDNLERLFIEHIVSRQINPDLSMRNQKIVAIGEIGLDYFWNDSPHDLQKIVLIEQLTLAAKLELPVVLHFRESGDAPHGDCAEDLINILEEWVLKMRESNNPLAKSPGVLHSFSGDQTTAKKMIDLNFFIGITGPVTFKNADAKREVVKSLPLERILIETDAPFLAPVPQRGRRNEPALVRHITDKIAEIHNKNPDEVAAITYENSMRLFSWGG
jgi:TatD DNase family protein